MKKINVFEEGYRKGVTFALINIINLLGDSKIKASDFSLKMFPLRIFLRPLLDKLDLFIEYGDAIEFACEGCDKKGNPKNMTIYYKHAGYQTHKQVEKLVTVIQALL